MASKSEKQLLIIQAAAEVFAKAGYHAATIQDVATAAGIGKSTVYEYFRTKEELFLAVYDEWIDNYKQHITTRVAEAPDALSKVDAIRDSAVEFYQTRAAQAPLLLEFWAHALRANNPEFLERVQKLRQFLRNLGNDLTSQLVESGWFEGVDVPSFTELETGISDGIFLGWVLEGKRFPLEKAYTFRQSVIGLGLLSGDARELLKTKLQKKLKKGFLLHK